MQVWKVGHNAQKCSEAEASVGEVAGGSRALEPEGPAESDGVCGWRTIQETQTTHQFHTTSHRSAQLVLWEERSANGPGDHRNCKGAELWPRGGPSLVLQPAADVEEHEQDQRLPSSVAKNSGRVATVCHLGRWDIVTAAQIRGLTKSVFFWKIYSDTRKWTYKYYTTQCKLRLHVNATSV